MVVSNESRWFQIAVLLISGFAAGFAFANIVYYYRLTQNNCPAAISSGEATTMLWINIILFILTLILFFWVIVRMFFWTSSVTQSTVMTTQTPVVMTTPVTTQIVTTPAQITPLPLIEQPVYAPPPPPKPDITSLETIPLPAPAVVPVVVSNAFSRRGLFSNV